jgi:hypothetical protein
MAAHQIPNPDNDPFLSGLNKIHEDISKPLPPPKDALHAVENYEPSPIHYRVDPADSRGPIFILEQQRGEDALVDQFRDQIEAAQKITTEAAEAVAVVNADPDLSDEGKAKRIAQINRDALKKLGQTADTLDKHDGIVREQMIEPLPYVAAYRDADYATPTIDVALVGAFKALDRDARSQAIASMLSGSDQRMADAILRLPAVLTGLSSTVVQNLREAAVNRAHPEEVHRRRSLEKASSAARSAISATVDKLARDGRLSRQEQRDLLGNASRHFPHLY